LKKGLASGGRAQPHPFLTVGRRVHVKSGPFEGRQGILLRRKGKLRLVLSIELIMRSVVIDVDIADVELQDTRQGARAAFRSREESNIAADGFERNSPSVFTQRTAGI
jgi:hypothetical protein